MTRSILSSLYSFYYLVTHDLLFLGCVVNLLFAFILEFLSLQYKCGDNVCCLYNSYVCYVEINELCGKTLWNTTSYRYLKLCIKKSVKVLWIGLDLIQLILNRIMWCRIWATYYSIRIWHTFYKEDHIKCQERNINCCFNESKKKTLEDQFKLCYQRFMLGYYGRKYKNYPIKERKLTPGKPVTALVSPQTHSIVNPISVFCNQRCLFQVWTVPRYILIWKV